MALLYFSIIISTIKGLTSDDVSNSITYCSLMQRKGVKNRMFLRFLMTFQNFGNKPKMKFQIRHHLNMCEKCK